MNAETELFGEINSSSCRTKDELIISLIQTASVSGGFFKHQQKDEPDLSIEEKENIVKDLLQNKPSTFIQRFGKYLLFDEPWFVK